MPSMLDKAETQLRAHFGNEKGVKIARVDRPKFTDDQKKRIKEAQARLRVLLGSK